MRAIKFDNFERSTKPMEKQKIIHLTGHVDIMCNDERLLVTRASETVNMEMEQRDRHLELFVYALPDGNVLHRLTGHTDNICYAKLTEMAGTKMLVSSAEDKSIRIWKLDTGVCVRQIDIGQWPVKASGWEKRNFAVHNNCAVYNSGPMTVVVWNIETGELLHALAGNPGDKFQSVALNGSHIFATSYGQPNSLKVWNRENGQLKHSVDMGEVRLFDCLVVHEDSVILHILNGSGYFYVFNTTTGKLSPKVETYEFELELLIHNNRIVFLGDLSDEAEGEETPPNRRVLIYSLDGQPLASIDAGPGAEWLDGVFGNGLAIIRCKDRISVNVVDLNAGQFVRSVKVAEEVDVWLMLDVVVGNTVLACLFRYEDPNDDLQSYVLRLIDFGESLP